MRLYYIYDFTESADLSDDTKYGNYSESLNQSQTEKKR